MYMYTDREKERERETEKTNKTLQLLSSYIIKKTRRKN